MYFGNEFGAQFCHRTGAQTQAFHHRDVVPVGRFGVREPGGKRKHDLDETQDTAFVFSDQEKTPAGLLLAQPRAGAFLPRLVWRGGTGKQTLGHKTFGVVCAPEPDEYFASHGRKGTTGRDFITAAAKFLTVAVLYRFSRDLRLDDHAGLAAAAELGEIIPLLIIDETTRERISCSPRRAAFYCGAIAALADALAERGAQLIVRRGPLAACMLGVAKESAASAVVWSASYSAPWIALERELQSRLEERGLRAVVVHDGPAIPPEETAVEKTSGGEGYRALVPYIQTWRELPVAAYEAPLFMRFARPSVQSEPLPSPDEFGASDVQLVASPAGATARLAQFLDADALHYSDAVNVPADDRTSHLAAHLSFGTISARAIVRETRRRMDDPFLLTEERASLKKYLAAIAHRDFFLQLAWFHPETQKMALQEKMRKFPFAKTHAALEAWQRGLTGYPLIDAGIRQLHATGWMHPRVRSIAASFLCFDLGVEWQAGVYEWDRHLVEDDEALAIGNWQWIAGVGADLAAYPRIYNPLKQERRFDPHGKYIRQWIPELANRVGNPLRVTHLRSLELPLFGPNTYPAPVVDHERAAREFLARYNAFVTGAVAVSSRQSSR